MLCSGLDITSRLFALCIQATMYGEVVESPFQHDVPQHGINVYLTQTDVTVAQDYLWNLQQLFDRLETAGLNSVSLTWPIYGFGRRSSEMFAGDETPSEEAIVQFVSVAKARGFGVMLHPVLDEEIIIQTSGPQHWRGTIAPWDVANWFSSYTELLVQYAELAQVADADVLVIGAEFESLDHYQEDWRSLAATMREVFPDGELAYASNWVISKDFPWDSVDYIGVDAFFHLDLTPFATQQEIAEAIAETRAEMVSQANELGKPLVFVETGTTSQTGSFLRSWRWDHGSSVSHEAQALYYQALCQTWAPVLDGLYWWSTSLYPLSDNQARTDEGFDPIGKPAELVMRSCFD